MSLRTSMLFLSLLSSGLAAGLLFGWLVSVLPGLSRISDETYVMTMQSINRAIINPAFIITFLIPPAVLGATAIVFFRNGETRRATLLAIGAATYLLGVLGITFGGNVPLNNTLDAFDLASASATSLAEQRQNYESPWNRWHTVRTLASLLALSLVSVAALTTSEAD